MTRVIYLMGQSNAEGDVDAADLPAKYDRYLSGAKFWTGSAFEVILINNQITWNLGGRTGEFGLQPFLSDIGWALRDDDVYIVPCVKGGTGLDNSYNHWYPNDTLYNSFASTVSSVDAWFDARGITYSVTHVVWYQGEKDATDSTQAAAYGANFATFRTSVNALFSLQNGSDPKWLVVRLRSDILKDHVDDVRAAQESAGSTYADTTTVNMDDCDLKDDDVHVSITGFETLGPRICNLILSDYGEVTRV